MVKDEYRPGGCTHSAGALEGGQAVSVHLTALRGHLALAVLQQEALPADLHCVRVHFQYLRKETNLYNKTSARSPS